LDAVLAAGEVGEQELTYADVGLELGQDSVGLGLLLYICVDNLAHALDILSKVALQGCIDGCVVDGDQTGDGHLAAQSYRHDCFGAPSLASTWLRNIKEWCSGVERTWNGRSEQDARSCALAGSPRHPRRGQCNRVSDRGAIRRGCASPGQLVSEVMVASVSGRVRYDSVDGTVQITSKDSELKLASHRTKCNKCTDLLMLRLFFLEPKRPWMKTMGSFLVSGFSAS